MDKWLGKIHKKRENTDYVQESVELSPATDSTLLETTLSTSIITTDNKRKVPPGSTSQLKNRKYNAEYLKYGFISSTLNNQERPMCVICFNQLSNDSMRPGKLVRHLATLHPEYKNKPIDFFQRKATGIKGQTTSLSKYTKLTDDLLKASFEIALLIAKSKKPYTIGEDLILPAAIKICEIIHGDKIATLLKSIPISNDTMKRRIDSIGYNIKSQLISRIKQSNFFAIQLDESTDITNCAQLMVFIRYQYSNQIHDDLLFCRELLNTTRGHDIFVKVDEFFLENELEWSKCVGVCTDGAAAMTGRISGFKAEVQKVSPYAQHIHCVIHREHLVFRQTCCELNDILSNVTTIVNFVKNRAVNSRLFTILCKEMGSAHDVLLYHTEIRWLSRGKVLNRIVELKDELRLFLLDKRQDLASHLSDEKWVCLASYLADYFDKVNELNLSLQGKDTNILVLNAKIIGFQKKLLFWSNSIKVGNIEMFPCLNEFLSTNEISISTHIKKIILNHIGESKRFFAKYFPDINEDRKYDWIRMPFAKTLKYDHINWGAQEELIDIRSENSLELEFHEKCLTEFWICRQKEYPAIAKEALLRLMPFATTYLCETAFSSLLVIKNKHRSCLSTNILEQNLRISISEILPDIDYLCKNMQSHPCH